MEEGELTLLYKKKDRKDIKNYRPITLLNSDLKLLTAALSYRMSDAVATIITKFQTGFMKGRFIAGNTQTSQLLQAIQEEDLSDFTAFIALDQEKAFDRVSWQTLNETIESLGFGPYMCQWFKTLYNIDKPLRRRIRLGGDVSEWYHIRSGVPQGDGLSPIAYICIMEGLARMIEEEERLPGIDVHGLIYKLSLYADDTLCFLAAKSLADLEIQLTALWDTLDAFCDATGAKINKTKTEGVAIGALRQHQLAGQSMPRANEIAWAAEGKYIVILGAPLGNNFNVHEYWDQRYKKFTARVARWQHKLRYTVAEARIPLISSLCLSLFWYQAQTLTPSKALGVQMKRDISYFVYKKEPKFNANAADDDKKYRKWLQDEVATQKKIHGGLGLPDWDAQIGALQAMWVMRYLDPAESPWKHLLDYYILPTAGPRGRQEVFSTLPLSNLLARLTPDDVPPASDAPDGTPPTTSLRARKAASQPILTFWRAAMSQFRRLDWIELRDQHPRAGPHVLAESFFHSLTHPPPRGVLNVKYWTKTCGIHHLRDIINPETADFYWWNSARAVTTPTLSTFCGELLCMR